MTNADTNTSTTTMTKVLNEIKNICVFCGSRKGNDETYVNTTKQLAEEMAKRNYGLIYGGGNIGIMGAVSEGVHNAGGRVKGIIPRSLSPKEISGVTIGEVVFVDNMHTRKEIMYNSSDAFIALPGGMGTFEELFECITWNQLGIHSKPVGILNINGYYDPLIALLKTSVDSGFVSGDFASSIIVSSDPIDLLNQLESKPPHKSELVWVTPSQV